MRSVLSIILIYSLAITSVFAQSVNPNDTLKIGNKSSSSDKGITFDTNDGVNNKKLLVEKISKKLKWDGNSVQIGDGSSSSDKEIVIAGALKSLKYNGTTGEFEFNDDLKLSGELKSDILRAINTEVSVKSLLRAEQGIKVGTGSNEIRVNAGNLEFSNDGVLYKKFGTGTGGSSTGISILENASFEDGITTGWTSSGGTFSQETYTNAVEGSTKYARFIASGAGQYFETTLKAIPDNFSGGCQADFKKVNVSGDDLFKVEVLDSSANVLTFGNVKKSSWVKFPAINFSCPTAGSTVKLRVTSLAAGTIEVDDAYLGSNQNLVGVNVQEQMVELSDSTGFGSTETTTRRFTNLQKQNGQGLFTTNFASQGVNGLQITMAKDAIVEGEYCDQGNTQGQMGVTVNVNGATNINSGITYASGLRAKITPATDYACAPFTFKALTGEVIRFQVGAPANFVASTINAKVSFKATTPVDSIAVNPEQSSWFIDANIGGTNGNLGTGNVSSYTEIASTSYDLVVNQGSSLVEIACASGTASSGLTCGAATESTGIAFFPPWTGDFEACADFSHYSDLGSNTNAQSVFQLIETANTNATIITEGKEKKTSGGLTGAALAGTVSSHKLCGKFTFSDVSKKTIRLMYEQLVTSGTLASSIILADRNASLGQREIRFTVRPLLSAFNRPILTGDQVTTPGVTNPKTYSFRVDSAGGVLNDYGDLVNGNCTSANPHVCTLNSGKFTVTPNCSGNTVSTASAGVVAINPSSSSIEIQARDGAFNPNNGIYSKQIICHGY